MLKLLLNRLAFGVLTLVATTFLIFWVNDLGPTDFATQLLGREYNEATAEVIREKYGLYLPVGVRYLYWLQSVLGGDFGMSWSGQEINPVIATRIQRSLWLAILAASIMFPIALALGIYSALKRYSAGDRVVLTANTMMLSIPEFLVGYALMALFAVKLGWFPSLALVDDDAALGVKLKASFMPILALAMVTIPPVMRIVRASLISALDSEYVQMAHLKGIRPIRIMFFHILPNNIGAIANALALGLANLIAGIVIIEMVFVYPGIGSLLLSSIYAQDIPMVLACGTVLACTYVVLLLIADLIAIASNPKLVSGDQNQLLHPGLVISGLKYAPVAMVLALALYLVQFLPDTDPDQTINWTFDSTPPAKDSPRAYIHREELLDEEFVTPGMIHNQHFLPKVNHDPALQPFAGALLTTETQLLGRRAGGKPRYGFGVFPEAQLEFLSIESTLVPVNTGVAPSRESEWALLLGEGLIWSEAADNGWSRAAFPFTLAGRRGGDSHAGIGTFIYRDEEVSNLRFQITMDTSRNNKFIAWGQVPARYSESTDSDRAAIVKAHLYDVSTRLKRKPWTDLIANLDPDTVRNFDGRTSARFVSTSGMIVDDVVYQKPCATAYGDYPFCDQARHGVFSVTKSLGAAVALMRLAQKYGREVLEEKIIDYVDIRASHSGWENVTFRHAIDMATGIGDVVPDKVEYYVDGDESEAAYRVFGAITTEDKIREIGRYNNYPWGPGEVLRYRTNDTYVLSVAMDRLLKSREGKDAMLWDMVNREVFQPVGIRHLPSMHTPSSDPTNRIPHLGYQLFTNVDDIGRVVRLLRNNGAHGDLQILHPELADEILNPQPDSGLPSGWTYPEGGEARYNLSTWLIPHRGEGDCWVMLPAMVGVGGNYVMPMPNNVTAFRFADRYEDDEDTYDTLHLRRTADLVSPFCR